MMTRYLLTVMKRERAMVFSGIGRGGFACLDPVGEFTSPSYSHVICRSPVDYLIANPSKDDEKECVILNIYQLSENEYSRLPSSIEDLTKEN